LASGVLTPGRNAVGVALQFLVQADERGLDVSADLEADDDQRGARAGGGVKILHVGNFPEQLFQRSRDAVLHLRRFCAGHTHEHIDDGDLDLWLLLAREHPDREKPQQHRGDDRNRSELRLNKGAGDAAGDPDLRRSG